MIYIHRTRLETKWEGNEHIAQLWYDYNHTSYPNIIKINMYRIENDGMVGKCVSSVTDRGEGENRLTLDDKLTGLLILIDDGVFNNNQGL